MNCVIWFAALKLIEMVRTICDNKGIYHEIGLLSSTFDVGGCEINNVFATRLCIAFALLVAIAH